MAVRETRIMPVAYSSQTASTASTVMTAWLRSTPTRASLVGSCEPEAEFSLRLTWVMAAMIAVTVMVVATVAASSQAVLGSVRSLVHSARSAADHASAVWLFGLGHGWAGVGVHASRRRSR